ncbi:hypothetical protein LJC07_07510 [Christensenellaceae bacterium OttesenSCG-928-L17]|nr:hypothetical protein [Christensenellaceae bacterium OttesenSCG-928-L17]
MKKIIHFIIIFCFVLLSEACASNDIVAEENRLALGEGFAAEAFSDIELRVFKYEGGSIIYPDDYAGCYYPKGKEELVIMSTDLSNIQTYLDATDFDEYISFELVEYNLNMLKEYAERIQTAYLTEFDYVIVDHINVNNKIKVLFLEEDYEIGIGKDLDALGLADLSDIIEFGVCWTFDKMDF